MSAEQRRKGLLVHMASFSSSLCRADCNHKTTNLAGGAVPQASSGNADMGGPASMTLGWRVTEPRALPDTLAEEGPAHTVTKTRQDGTKSLFSAFNLVWRCSESW